MNKQNVENISIGGQDFVIRKTSLKDANKRTNCKNVRIWDLENPRTLKKWSRVRSESSSINLNEKIFDL